MKIIYGLTSIKVAFTSEKDVHTVNIAGFRNEPFAVSKSRNVNDVDTLFTTEAHWLGKGIVFIIDSKMLI